MNKTVKKYSRIFRKVLRTYNFENETERLEAYENRLTDMKNFQSHMK